MSTKIEWATETWNPVVGCTRVSPGCAHCYARELVIKRWKQPFDDHIVLHPDRLAKPLTWRKPRRVFVNSMSDLFHTGVPDEFIDQVFAVMALSPQHTFQVLTKRPERMREYLSHGITDKWPEWIEGMIEKQVDAICAEHGWCSPTLTYPPPNVWLGVSAENQRWADERIPLLLDTPAAVRFVSCEPLLGPVDLTPWLLPFRPSPDSLDWVIVGAESGADRRLMRTTWLDSIVSQCQQVRVPVFVKQGSAFRPGQQGEIPNGLWALKEYPS